VSHPSAGRSTCLGKIAVSGEHAEPDCVSSPETEIFDQDRQDHLVNEVIYPANRGCRVIRAPGLSTARGPLDLVRAGVETDHLLATGCPADTFWSSQIALRGVYNGVGCVLAVEITSLMRWFVPAGGGVQGAGGITSMMR
jgi:hypothetical protein